MSWKNILKVDMQEANRLGREYAMNDPSMRQRVVEDAENKSQAIIDTIMKGIEIFDEGSFSPKDSFGKDLLEKANNTFAFAYSYNTIIGQIYLSVGLDGEVYEDLFGFYDVDEENNKLNPGTPIDMAKAKQLNKDMKKQQKRELAGQTQRSQIGYAETPDEYYYF